MAEARFSVTFAGPHVSIQDGGRTGYMRFGVPASGPMDRAGFAMANVALGNPWQAAAIEVSMLGLTLACAAGTVTLGLAGGGFKVQLGEEVLPGWSVVTIRAGERLTIQPGSWGTWTYIAFAGQLEAASWLGSLATHATSGLGGGKLATGQELVVRDAAVRERRHGPIACPDWARPRSEPHVVLGPQSRFFSATTIETFLATTFSLSDAYDRMGVRLRGPALIPDGALSIPSAPISRGSVQVSGDGAATVLLADHQTTGGYPKIATMLADDVSGFAQNRPRDTVAFRSITPAEAVRMARQAAVVRTAHIASLARREGD
ncbi:MAG: biotin-dependent carboxyltransferase family protein [Hyphomicrobiaceae bacterium]